MGLLEGKIGLITGVANENSLAWSCAKTWHENGAELIFACKEYRFDKISELVSTLDPKYSVICCDVENKEDITTLFDEISKNYGKLDLFLHSIAFAPKNAFESPFSELTNKDFLETFNVSVYSFIEMSRNASYLMADGGSIQTITYLGSEKVVPVYNVMGPAKAALESSVKYLANDLGPYNIRVNAISSGPVNTLAARGVPGFRDMLERDAEIAPLRRNVNGQDIGGVSLFLASDLSSGVTGDVIYVDCGAHNVLM